MRLGSVVTLLSLSSSLTALDDAAIELDAGGKIEVERHDNARVRIDGRLDEAVWQKLPAYDEFLVIQPDTLNDTSHATRVRIFYDAHGLYVGIDMDQPKSTLVKRLSGRDARGLNRDTINLTLDTSGEGRYGYWFGVGLGDSLMDGTVLPERQFSNDWDGAWRAATSETDNGWSAEFHIPWGSVAMPRTGEVRRLGLFMSRKVAYLDQRWGWPGLPDTKPKFISELQALEVRNVAPRQQYSVYPFTAVTNDRIDNDIRYRVGADFFWRPSTDFQLTATANPDFGAVESDDAVINLSATETFFPEKRLFFLEGQEVFFASPRADTRGGGVGNRGAPVTMVNTRRIGGKPPDLNLPTGVSVSRRELAQPVDLIGAAKVTGSRSRFRYGVLAAFEDDFKLKARRNGQAFKLPQSGSDYAVARLLYEDAPGGAYRAFGFLSTAVFHADGDAVAHGLDGHYLGHDGKWKIDGQMFTSDIDGEERGYGGFLDFEYTLRQGVSQRVGIEYFDEHVDLNDLGFHERNDNFRIRWAHIRSTSKLKWARDNEFDFRGFVQKNSEDLFTGGGLFFSNRTTFDNLSRLVVRVNFFPESYDDLNSFGNGSYRIEERVGLGMGFGSDSSKKFHFGGGVGMSHEQLRGKSYNVNANFNWRPTGRFNMSFGVGYQDRNGWLLHQENENFTTFDAELWSPRFAMDYFLSAKQQFRISMQWIGLKAQESEFFLIPATPGDLIPTAKPPGPPDSFTVSQLSMQARYRWEIAPLSDIFIVYTRTADHAAGLGDSSFSDVLRDGYDNPLTDALVFKIRYRFGS